MLGIRTFTASFLLIAGAFSAAAQTDPFPLQTRNSWAYRSASRFASGSGSIEVQGKETFQNREYFKVNFFERSIFLRQAETSIRVFDTETNQESLWLDFGAASGTSIPVSIDPCTRAARLISKTEKVTTPAGSWDNAIHFTFEPSCADAGVTAMYFVPGVGPVVYETTSFAGPVRWELVYARAANTVAEGPQVAFTVALDAPLYQAADLVPIKVRLSLRNTHDVPVNLLFPSSQRYDLRIWNARNQIVYTWSADKLFAQVVSREQVSGERTFTFTADVPNLAPGRYVAEAFLATSTREYVGVVGFEVGQVIVQ